jgi:8-oxo-dGTP pyrophosphatase MutT (NUDIX family)
MHRNYLSELLHNYSPSDSNEIISKQLMIDFISNNPDCFERTLSHGHFTASCWLVNKSMDRALLTHHAKLNTWLQLGGHCDGDSNIIAVALKEAQEESGLFNIKLVSEQIFDIDVHAIPANSREPGHLHYDVRFLVQVLDDAPLIISPESKDLCWFGMDVLALPTKELSIVRMFNKWLALRGQIVTFS